LHICPPPPDKVQEKGTSSLKKKKRQWESPYLVARDALEEDDEGGCKKEGPVYHLDTKERGSLQTKGGFVAQKTGTESGGRTDAGG